MPRRLCAGLSIPWRWMVGAFMAVCAAVPVALSTGLAPIMAMAVFPAPTALAAPASSMDDIARINRYLSEFQSFDASFYQEDGNGGFASGRMRVSRPGKILVEYDPPLSNRIIADGKRIHFYDWQLDSITTRPIDETAAVIILNDDLVLGKRFRVDRFEKKKGIIRVRIADRKNPDAGTLDLVFDAFPLTLKQWALRDARGIETRISLFDIEKVASFDPSLFHFDGLRLERIPFALP